MIDKDVPDPRSGHQMAIDIEGDKIFIFGGSTKKLVMELNDLYCYDLGK